MQRTTIYLDDREHQALKVLAARKGTTMTEIIRRLVQMYLHGVEAERRRAQGSVRS